MSFNIVIVTPEQQVLDETVRQVILPAHDGQIGILTDRAPLLVKLGMGPLRIDPQSGPSRTLFVEGGVAQMKDNKLTVLTNEAILAEQISAEAARAEFAEADAQRPNDPKSAEDRQRRLNRARALQAMAGSAR